MKTTSIKSLVYIAIGTALISTLSQISLSIGPVPFTLQTLAIGLVACLYKPKEAITSVCLYLVLGAIGLPVLLVFLVALLHSQDRHLAFYGVSTLHYHHFCPH